MKKTMLAATVSGLSLALLLPACAADEDQGDEIASALENENGGLDTEDELPMFGDAAQYEGAEFAESVAFADTMENDADTIAMMERPDAALYNTEVLWGQMPGDRDTDTVRNWSGRISVNRGAIVLRRTIRFEGVTDRILPREDRRYFDFTSATRPHFDGVVFTIIDPTPESSEPLVLNYNLADGDSYDLPVADLVDGFESRIVDEAGNRITAGAIRRLVDVCEHGRLRGRWHKVGPRGGVFLGGVANALGEPVGHVRGIYGTRRNGDKVFFGKYINLEGRFKGILAGTYENGHFLGRWLTRAGEHGVLGGEYRETVPGPRVGGHFLGRWTETACDMPLPRPRDAR